MAELSPNAHAFSIDSLLQNRKQNQNSDDIVWSQRQPARVVTMSSSNMVNPGVPISTDPQNSQNNFISLYSPAVSFGAVASRSYSENDLLKQLLQSNQETDQQSLSRSFMMKELEKRGNVNDCTTDHMTHLINSRLETSLPSNDFGSVEGCGRAELNSDVVMKTTNGNALKKPEFRMKLSEEKDTRVCYSNEG